MYDGVKKNKMRLPCPQPHSPLRTLIYLDNTLFAD